MNRLLIFTQKVDSEDPVLGFFCGWITAFAQKMETVHVICLEEGKYNLPKNVTVYSLDKERGASRMENIVHLWGHLYIISGQYDKVFVHMNPIYLVLCGLYFKLKGIKTYLWYVHRKVDLKLRISALFADKIFTSAKESFGIKTDKVVYLGHGIDINLLPYTPHLYTGDTLRITHIGRITPIKNIETLIDACYQLKKKNLDVQLNLYGDCITENDKDYKISLEKIIKDKGLKKSISFMGSISHKNIPATLSNCHISVNMAPTGGMDKAVLESILLGIPTFVSNTAFTELFGEYADRFMYRHGDYVGLAEKIYNFTHATDNQHIMNTLNKKVRIDFSLERLIEKLSTLMS